jgi:hypothetical protein
MSEMKTTPNDGSVDGFLDGISDERQRADAKSLDRLMREVTGQSPRMWGDSIVGYGTYHYRYASGREGDWMKVGFAPRKGKFSIYLSDRADDHTELLSRLGRHKSAVSCLYVKRLEDVDMTVLAEIIRESYAAQAMGQT